MTDSSADQSTERPAGWPETFTDPSLDCSHAFTWDSADGAYLCMYCGESRAEPPNSAIQAQRESNHRAYQQDSDYE